MNAAAKDQKAVNEMVAAPHQGWVLIARRRIQSDHQIYDVGCEVPPAALGRNFQALLDARFVGWVPSNETSRAKPPRRAAPPEPARRPNPPILIVADRDAVTSWKKSVVQMTKLTGGDRVRARDLLLADDAGSRLFLKAARIAAERGAPFRRIVPADL